MHEACATAEPGTVWLTQAEPQNGRRITLAKDGAIPVVGVDLAKLLKNVEEVALLKCDIEGGEKALFKNAGAWVSKIKLIVIELHPPYTLDELLSDLTRAGCNFIVLRKEIMAINGLTMAFLAQAR